jgi:osmoprotectant transport system ATP-binding protein
MIKLENLTKHFSQKHGQTFKAVDNVNLNVPEGKCASCSARPAAGRPPP